MTEALTFAGFVCAHWVLRCAKHAVTVSTLARWAWASPRPGHRRDRDRERRLLALALAAGRRAGTPSRDCVERSILLYGILSRTGADPTLVVGFTQRADQLGGHAWVTVDGAALVESADNLAAFVETMCFRAGRATDCVRQ